jgi:undecaprenyl diphosphate synthase
MVISLSLLKKKVSFDPKKLPVHIGIILDGNGRWAKKRGLPRTVGHAAGAENFRTIATFCREIGIKYLTVFAFSTENWKRPKDEVDAIWELLRKYLAESIEKMERDRVKIRIMGAPDMIPEDIRELMDRTKELSERFDGITLCICLNYGGRDEIVHAVREMVVRNRDIKPEMITTELIEKHLYSAGIPDPDLIIRPSGEMRMSNFLIWQSAYSEFYSTKTLWPDFDTEELVKAISEYQKRERRFGGIDQF